MKLSWGTVRVRSVWLVIFPFFWFAQPRWGLFGAGVVLAVSGLLTRAWAASWIHKNKVLATSGPYAFTRNPLYLGSFLLGLGVMIAGGQPTFIALFLAFFFVVYVKTMLDEARTLAELFGESYARYAAAVPLFFPRLSPWVDPGVEGPQSAVDVKQYMVNREYEALLGALVAFALLAAKMIWVG